MKSRFRIPVSNATILLHKHWKWMVPGLIVLAPLMALFALRIETPRYEGKTLVQCLRAEAETMAHSGTPEMSIAWVKEKGAVGVDELLRLAAHQESQLGLRFEKLRREVPFLRKAFPGLNNLAKNIYATEVLEFLCKDPDWTSKYSERIFEWFLAFPSSWPGPGQDPTLGLYYQVISPRFQDSLRPRDPRAFNTGLLESHIPEIRLDAAVALSRYGAPPGKVAEILIDAIENSGQYSRGGSPRERAYAALRRIDPELAEKYPVTLTRQRP